MNEQDTGQVCDSGDSTDGHSSSGSNRSSRSGDDGESKEGCSSSDSCSDGRSGDTTKLLTHSNKRIGLMSLIYATTKCGVSLRTTVG